MEDVEYWLYNCPICDQIWCSDDPLLKTPPEDCPDCGCQEIECGLVNPITEAQNE